MLSQVKLILRSVVVRRRRIDYYGEMSFSAFRKSRNSKKSDFNEASLSLNEAKKKIMDLVARRDHSELEIKKKLAPRCEDTILQEALDWAKNQNWLSSTEKLTAQFARQLDRRGKGIRQINKKLTEKGLNTIKPDFDNEYDKAQRLTLLKWERNSFQDLDFEQAQKLKGKIIRYLLARGFENSIVSKILKNEFRSAQNIHEDEI